MKTVVLDASAVLAMLQNEPGAETVLEALPGAIISSVNLAEVLYKSAARGVEGAAVLAGLRRLGLEVHAFDVSDAERVSSLHVLTRSRGLSLADLACLALGQRLGASVVHAEHRWAQLEVGIELRHIRPRRSQRI